MQNSSFEIGFWSVLHELFLSLSPELHVKARFPNLRNFLKVFLGSTMSKVQAVLLEREEGPLKLEVNSWTQSQSKNTIPSQGDSLHDNLTLPANDLEVVCILI